MDNRPVKSSEFNTSVTDKDLTDFLKDKDLICIAPITATVVGHKDGLTSLADVANLVRGGSPRVYGGRTEDNIPVSYTYFRVFYYDKKKV